MVGSGVSFTVFGHASTCFCTCSCENSDLLLPNIHCSCQSHLVPDKAGCADDCPVKPAARRWRSCSSQLMLLFIFLTEPPIARFHNIQLSFESNLRAWLMTRGSSHEIEPSGQMSVEVSCMLIFSAFFARFCNLTSEKQRRGAFLRKLKWQRRTKHWGILSRAFWREFYWSANDEAEVPEGSV